MRASFFLVGACAALAGCSSNGGTDGGTTSHPDAATDGSAGDAAEGGPGTDAGTLADTGTPRDLGGVDAPAALDAGHPAVCGDGTIEAPEQCDDGNTANGDGCSSVCDLEPDVCPGDVTAMPLVAGSTVTGDTSTGSRTSGAAGSCGGGSAAEDIYTFTLTTESDVTVTTDLPATTFDTALYVRSPCGDRLGELGCESGGTLGDTVLLTGVMPGTYFVFVDGVTGGAGAYALSLTVSPSIPDGGACDPSGSTGHCLPGSACSGGVCVSASVACAASATTLTPGTPVMDTTVGAMDLYGPACSSDGASPERVYHVHVDPGNDLQITATPTMFATEMFDIVLTVEQTCGDTSTSVGCSDLPSAMSTETVTVTAASGDYYVFVDGYGASPTSMHAGHFTLTATLL